MISFGSVCSGIEAASVAFTPLGWKAAWFSEIEPFPSAVLKHHYPDVPNLGDMTALPERILSGEIEAPDMLCGGTPCQAFSVAGLRNSLDDHRGNLTLTFVEIANAIDERRLVRGLDPAIIFWENVPGVLNTKDNAFGCFLAGLAGESVPLEPPGGRWANAGFIDGPQRAVAWRVLDAQYFGVAQRRRRVFVVASAGEDFDPAAVLFEFDGVRRDTAPSRETGQGVTHATAPCLTSSGRGVERTGDTRGQDPVIAVNYAPEIARYIATREGSSQDFETTTMVTAIPIHDKATRHAGHSQDRANADGSGNGLGIGQEGDPMYTITTGDKHAVAQPIAFTTEQTPKFNFDQALTLTKQSPTGGGQPQAVAQPVMAFKAGQSVAAGGIFVTEDYSPTLQAQNNGSTAVPCIAFSAKDHGADSTVELSPTLRAMGHSGSHANGGGQMAVFLQDDMSAKTSVELAGTLRREAGGAGACVVAQMQVRRLTPVECERLQGFPDGYTNIPWRGKPESSDGPRYKALGNSWAVPVVRWIGERINRAL